MITKKSNTFMKSSEKEVSSQVKGYPKILKCLCLHLNSIHENSWPQNGFNSNTGSTRKPSPATYANTDSHNSSRDCKLNGEQNLKTS